MPIVFGHNWQMIFHIKYYYIINTLFILRKNQSHKETGKEYNMQDTLFKYITQWAIPQFSGYAKRIYKNIDCGFQNSSLCIKIYQIEAIMPIKS